MFIWLKILTGDYLSGQRKDNSAKKKYNQSKLNYR